jgi:type I restriction enzyme S subunit
MGSDIVLLGELLTVLTDYHANGAYKKLKENVELLDNPNYAAMIRTTNFEQNNFDQSLKFINEHAYHFLKKSKVYAGDLIMNKIANAGSCYLMPELGMPVSLAMNLFLLRVNSKKANPSYVYLYLKLNEAYVKSFSNGSVTKTITKDAVRNLEVVLPDRETQNDIVATYEAYTKKIDLNRQTNQTLEKMAQALFKSWFVDFDPVIDNALEAGNPIPNELQDCAERRKQQLAKPDHKPLPEDIRQLFPSEFELTEEMGWVPKGWCGITLGERMQPSKGKNITKKTIVEGVIPVVAGGLSPAYYHNTYNVSAPVITASASGANAGYVNLYQENIWASDCSYINSNHTNHVFSTYLFLKEKQNIITLMQQGAAQPHVYPKDLMRLELVNPPSEIWDFLEATITPNFKRIKANKLSNKSLISARDILHPKLISGELRLPSEALAEAEQQLAETIA